MNFETYLLQRISFYLKNLHPHWAEVLHYSFFPTGKLFRANLILSLGKDLEIEEKELYPLALSIEMHHLYSLIHDDLPCMDNDDYRRGKESVHKKFKEWLAVLAGDAWINASYEELTELSFFSKAILKFFSKALGMQGLIQGQFLDLNDELKNKTELFYLHELKTGRLIQLCCVIPTYGKKNSLKTKTDFWKLGKLIGIAFQIKDDIEDTAEHGFEKKNICTWQEPEQVKITLLKIKQQIEIICQRYKLKETQKLINSYYR